MFDPHLTFMSEPFGYVAKTLAVVIYSIVKALGLIQSIHESHVSRVNQVKSTNENHLCTMI